ncbi:MAG: nicotinate-nucleotide--dimethylbenzimidazole phosphoribosyltransferase [Atopobiaceae bacterium]
MLDFSELNRQIVPLDAASMEQSRAQWNAIAKPVGSLGAFEILVERMAGIIGSKDVDIHKRCVVVVCSDNGVVAEGVTQGGSEITRAIADALATGQSSVCALCAPAHIEVRAVDVGMAQPARQPQVKDLHIARGTGNIVQEPAMDRASAEAAIQVGMDLIAQLAREGYGIVATGEMGIGNTTTSSAMASVYLDAPAEEVTGKGAGLSEKDYAHKIDVVRRAVARRAPDPHDALDVLAKLGGYDIAALAGMFIGGALFRVPVIMDGFISEVAALTAVKLVPACKQAIFASHLSVEPAAKRIMDELGFDPVLHAGMHLGEGTGAVCLIPLLDMALSLYGGTTFEETGIEAYDPSL